MRVFWLFRAILGPCQAGAHILHIVRTLCAAFFMLIRYGGPGFWSWLLELASGAGFWSWLV
eukprot:10218696-Karenia_brevis.AAC.1